MGRLRAALFCAPAPARRIDWEERGGEIMRFVPDYDRMAAVRYAHRWAFGRNPRFYDYEEIGGDCTNFASQCLFAGGSLMNFVPDFGWYYISANQKSPSWTGVEYLYDFLTRKVLSIGPVGEECGLEELRPGDLLQLSFTGEGYQHILVAAHSYDADNRPLSTYNYQKLRGIHITGNIRP